jgi:hypothetical protein
MMQVYCRKTDGNAELHCCVCGQGFVMFWDRQTSIERAVTRAEIQEILRRQHRAAAGREAHAYSEFAVPEWDSMFRADSLVTTGKVPVWNL